AFRAESAERLAQAVRIETISFDDMKGQVPVETDPRRQGFLKLRDHYETAYPLVHEHLRREIINVFGLLFTLEGTDHTLKPMILMAHTDVVPVAEETISQWAHPPFSGFIDGERVWGRGSIDCKNSLSAQLEAVELLLKAGFAPARTIILAYGFDEEINGLAGAKYLADTLYTRYGHNGAELIVDEGTGRDSSSGLPMAQVVVQEKGYTDIKITVSAPGGHSSIPPPHTAIGILAKIITAIEANPYSPALEDAHPLLEMLRCGARWNPNFDPWIKSALQHIDLFRDEIVAQLAADPETKNLIATSQAVDVVQGGTKVNALPESSHIVINHRIALHQSVAAVESHLLQLILPIAEHHLLGVTSLRSGGAPKQLQAPQSAWAVEMETLSSLEPTPRTPSGMGSSEAWDALAGTVRHVYSENVVVTPWVMAPNTDTRHYLNLTENVFRFNPGNMGIPKGLHTVNESFGIDAHVTLVSFYHEFIRNV
ncbi:carboxypeptidase S, partial [Blyttiomyces helicus]